MWLEAHWKNIRQTLLLLFTAALLIGVTMLAISSNINPVGYFFLGVGGVCLIGYLLSVLIECYLKHRHDANEIPPNSQSQEGINAAYEAPTYEEVMTMSAPAIWTIASNPGSVPSPLSEPPPYNVVIESTAQGETAVVIPGVSVASNTRSTSEPDRNSRIHLQLVLPRSQQRFISDTNEMKGNADRYEPLEPLTPPPAYESAIYDEVFEDVFQPSILD
ncbi:transmembrane protein 139 [Lagopus leucura]|uniref:transmembrane protein 139 n=1 Tax=Lagopus leucura TaxID=30410 RepID=UPI001C6703B3|nr:transmembrane protein 139 [Lagopus leucura]XP_042722422.1 transmembrane protein 139 [Lagopus leucura]